MNTACGIILSLVGATLALPGNFQVKDLDDCIPGFDTWHNTYAVFDNKPCFARFHSCPRTTVSHFDFLRLSFSSSQSPFPHGEVKILFKILN